MNKKNKSDTYSCTITLQDIIGSLALVLTFAISLPVNAVEPVEYEMINITAGQVGILDNLDGAQRYGLEYRFKSFAGPYDFRLIPAIGAVTSNNGANFLYTDLRHDFYLSDQWLLIPSFGLGVFKDSDELDLGNDFQFRSGIELAYQFKNFYRAGIAIFHLSNGGLSDHNPGTEALVFSLCIPLKKT